MNFERNTGACSAGAAVSTRAVPAPAEWGQEADVVVIGAGATGLPAAIVAREAGASVILVEARRDIGGHAITSGGNVPLGGGTSAQKKYGIEDSPDLVFRDLTDWSVVSRTAFPITATTTARSSAPSPITARATFEWLVAHGVVFVDKAPDDCGGTLGRQFRAARNACRRRWTGRWSRPASRPTRRVRTTCPPAMA